MEGTRLAFRNPEITADVVLASGCLPTMFQAIEIDGEAPPQTSSIGLTRFLNSPLMKELRMIALLRQAVDPGTGEGARWAQMRTHRITGDMLAQFGASSKLNAEWDFVAMLRTEGRRVASEFLDAHSNDLGRRSTADLDVLLAEC